MIDVVYPLGHGSHWQDNELRYSLRSLAQYVAGVRHVYVVGARPSWLTNVHHIAHPDPHTCKERNIMEKILRACQEPGLSDRFLFANDDHFALGPSDADVPYWRAGQLADLALKLNPRSHYRQALLNTHQVLQGAALPTWNFDVHLPIVYDKELFPLAMRCYDWERHRGYVVKSLYANTVHVSDTYVGDIKLTQRHTMAELVQLLGRRYWWSIGPSALSMNLKNLLAALYPDPSPYER